MRFEEYSSFLDVHWRQLEAWDEAVSLYNMWRDEAKRGVMCWMWISRHLNVMKDIRLLIAEVVWIERSSWGVGRSSENKTVSELQTK